MSQISCKRNTMPELTQPQLGLFLRIGLLYIILFIGSTACLYSVLIIFCYSEGHEGLTVWNLHHQWEAVDEDSDADCVAVAEAVDTSDPPANIVTDLEETVALGQIFCDGNPFCYTCDELTDMAAKNIDVVDWKSPPRKKPRMGLRDGVITHGQRGTNHPQVS